MLPLPEVTECGVRPAGPASSVGSGWLGLTGPLLLCIPLPDLLTPKRANTFLGHGPDNKARVGSGLPPPRTPLPPALPPGLWGLL